jgi:hypothetical protein
LISVVIVVVIPKVRNESEDFGRDPVDRCKVVPPGPNQVEDLENVLFQNVELNTTRVSRDPRIRFDSLVRLTSAWSNAVAAL